MVKDDVGSLDEYKYPEAALVEFSFWNCHDQVREASNYLLRQQTKLSDDGFRKQLAIDKNLHSTMSSFLRNELDYDGMNEGCKSQVITIDRALQNRLFFAVRQKREIEHLYYTRQLLAHEAISVMSKAFLELETVIDLIKDWNTTSMKPFRDLSMAELKESKKRYSDALRNKAIQEVHSVGLVTYPEGISYINVDYYPRLVRELRLDTGEQVTCDSDDSESSSKIQN